MDFLSKALEALPSIATSPLAFVGYVLTVAAWVYAVFRARRLKLLLARLSDIPEVDRARIIQLELGEVLPVNITAEQWLRGKRQKYFFVAFILLLVTLVSVLAVAIYQGQARLLIDDVQEVLPAPKKKSSLQGGLVRVQLNNPSGTKQVELAEDPADQRKYRYTFDITLRNPSPEPVNATELRIIFDPGKGGAIASVQEISGTYVVAVTRTEATTSTPLGRFQAYAWYPSGSGRLHVKTPIAQTLAPKSVDRIRIIVEFPDDYRFLGPMEDAVLQVYWNANRYEQSIPIKLAKR